MADRFKYIQDYAANNPRLCYSALEFLLGDYIGKGCSRTVFKYALDPKYVIKIAKSGSFDNILEYEIWCNIRYTEHKKYFAPCSWISDDGVIMLQRKTKPIYTLPETLPSYFSDIKPDNFGMIGKQIVAHDYAFSLDRFIALTNLNKTRKVNSIYTK